jgi:hypothetical protein
MPFNPTLPATNSPLASAEMRAQLTALNTDIQTRALQSTVNSAIASVISGSSANTNGVGTLGISADGSYDPSQFQQVIDKLDELISAARR